METEALAEWFYNKFEAEDAKYPLAQLGKTWTWTDFVSVEINPEYIKDDTCIIKRYGLVVVEKEDTVMRHSIILHYDSKQTITVDYDGKTERNAMYDLLSEKLI
jgi:hypothetical protein